MFCVFFFTEVLEVNAAEGWVLVQPLIRVRSLVKQLLDQHQTLAVAPTELDVTVHDAVMGACEGIRSHYIFSPAVAVAASDKCGL